MVGQFLRFLPSVYVNVFLNLHIFALLLTDCLLSQITYDNRYNHFHNSYTGIDNEIVAVNLNCINYDDPTNDKCNDGWLFRKANAIEKTFLKYSTLTFSCKGQLLFLIIIFIFCKTIKRTLQSILCFVSEKVFKKRVNNPCEGGNDDTWTYERFSSSMSKYEGIKKKTRYDMESGCCRKLASHLKRNNLHLIMEMMKHSLGNPIPDKRQNQRFDRFTLAYPKEDVAEKIEKE